MARLFQYGFELNSQTIEFPSVSVGSSTIQTTTVHGGTYAWEVHSLSSGSLTEYCQVNNTPNTGYHRVYFRYATLPTTACKVIALGSVSTGWSLKLTTTGTLQLLDTSNAQIGSDSPAMNANQWYRIEMFANVGPVNGSRVVTARLDGADFATSSTQTIAVGPSPFFMGGNLQSEANATGDWFFDDYAVNDTTGSFQTSWPGPGQILLLSPNAAGDNNAWATNVGGTAGTANNFGRVNEIPPNDATSYNGTASASLLDDFNVANTPAAFGLNDTVSCVMVGVRYSASAASPATFAARCKKAATGTVSTGATITPSVTPTWTTNVAALILYQTPDSATWTKALLDSMQIGYSSVAAGTGLAWVSNVFVTIDYIAQRQKVNNMIGQAVRRASYF